MKRHPEPLLWMLFSAGGVASGMLMPVLVLLFGIAFPLGWVTPPTYDAIRGLLANPLAALVVFVLCVLSLFHSAHRFRHTLYDGLQIKHLNEVIAVVSYGVAVAGSGIHDLLTGRSFGWRQPLGLVVTVVALLAPLAGAAWWAVAGVSGPLDRQAATPVPISKAASRTLPCSWRRSRASSVMLRRSAV